MKPRYPDSERDATPGAAASPDKVVRLYRSGKSTRQIAERFGVSRNLVLRRLKTANVTLRMSTMMVARMRQAKASLEAKKREAAVWTPIEAPKKE